MSTVITPFEGTELFNTASFNNRIAQMNTGFSYISNPNLLDNWYFGNPVNQRGQTEYTENWKYGIDRWLCAGDGKVTIADGHCVFYGAVDQGLSVQMSDILGCTMTASLLLADGTLLTGTAVNTDNSIDIPFVSNVDGMHLNLNATDLSGHRRFRTCSAPERAVLAAKLELGSTQTLAHREGDKWALNEVPNYGDQLRRCQRYFWRFSPAEYVAGATAFGTDANTARAMIYLSEQMRTSPALNLNASEGFFLTGASGDIFNTTVSTVWTAPNSVCVDFKKSGAFEVNAPYFVRGGDFAYIDISADL